MSAFNPCLMIVFVAPLFLIPENQNAKILLQYRAEPDEGRAVS